MKRKQILEALEGHENAAEILAVLDEDPAHDEDRKKGYVVGEGGLWLEGANTGEPEHTVHRLAHWEGGWDAEQHQRHDERQRAARASHGLQFLEKPNRKGKWGLRPSSRKKCLEQYREQVREEQGNT